VADLNSDGKPDLIVANDGGNSVSMRWATAMATSPADRHDRPAAGHDHRHRRIDRSMLVQDPDHTHVDWTMGTAAGQMLINDANGLTINGAGGSDVIAWIYTN